MEILLIFFFGFLIFTGNVIAALLRPPEGGPRLLLAAHIFRPVRRVGRLLFKRLETTTYLKFRKKQ